MRAKREPPVRLSGPRRVSRRDFLSAPAEWLEYARQHGTITIVDELGNVRATLSVPNARTRVREPR